MTNDIDINLSLNMEDKTKNLSSWSSKELDAGIVQKRAEVFQLEGQLKTVTDKISKTLDTKKQQLQKEIIKREQELTAETENNEDIAQARKTAEIAEKKYNEAVAKIWKPTEALRAKRAITPIKQRGEIDKEIAELEKKAGVTLDEVQKLQENKKSSQSDYEKARASAKKSLEAADKKLADLREQLKKTKDKENETIRQTEEYKRYDAAIREKEALEKEVEKRIAAAQQKLDRATAKQQEAEASRQKPQRVSPPPSVTRPDKLRGRPWTPQEIAAKLKVGESVHAPMILRTRDKKGGPIHDYEYTGISEEELIKYYHMSPAEAKKLAPQYTPEMYNKLLPSLKGMATISTLAGITEGKGGPYRGPKDAGPMGTAAHTSTEMALSGWSLDDILKEYSKYKTKGKSRLSQEQFADLSGLDIISEKYGGDWKKVKSYLQSVLDTSKIGIEDDENLIMEKSFGVITNMGAQGGLVPWGGTLDIYSLLRVLRDIKTNQNMSNKMGAQVNMIARAIGIARESGYDIPEPEELSIAHSPSPRGEGHFPTPQLYSIRKMSAEEDDRMIQDALLQYREKGALPNPHYSDAPFKWIGKLYSPLVLPSSSSAEERLPLEITREEGKRSQYLVGGHNILGMTPQQIADLRGILTPEDYQRLVNIAFSTKQYTAKMQDGKKVLDQNGQPITEVSEGDKFYHKGVRWNTLRKYLTSPYANAKDKAQNHGLLEGIDMQTFQDEEGIEGRTLGGLTAAGMSKLYRVTKATQGEQAEKLSQQFIDLYVRSINAALKSVNPLDVKDAQSFVYTLMSLGERDEVHEPFVKAMEKALLDSTGPARDVVSNLSEYDLHFSELNKEELEMREKGSEQQKLANAPKATAEIRKRLQAITTGMLDAVFQDASQNGLDTTSPAFQSFLTEVSSIKSEIGDEITSSLSSGGLMQSLKAGFITQDEYEQAQDNFQKKIDESEDFTYMYDEWREGVRRQIEASTLSDKDKKTFLSRFALASNLDDSGGTPVQMGYKLARLVVAQQAYDKMLGPIYKGMSLRGSTASKEEIAEMALTETQLREYRDSVALQKRMSEAPNKGYESKEELVKYLLMGLAEDEGVGSREGNAIRRGGRALAGNEEAFEQFVNAFALRMGLGEGGMPPALNTLLSGFVDEGPFAGASRQELMQIGFGVGVTHPSADVLEVREDEIRAREDRLRSLQEAAEQEKVTAENSILNIEHLKERLAAVTQEFKQLQAEIEKNNGASEEQFLQKSKLWREQGSLLGMIRQATELPRQLKRDRQTLEKIKPGLPDALLYLLSEPDNAELKDSIFSTFDTAGLGSKERAAALQWAKDQAEWDSRQSVREEQRENQEKAKNAALMQELLAQPQFAEAAQRMLKGLEPTPLPEFLTPGWKAYGDWEVHNDNPQKTTNVISNGVNPSDVIIPDNANLVDAFARLAGQDSEAVIPAIDGTVVEQQEAISALEQRAGVEQEAIKIDQQSTQALRDESEALKNKAEIARELISALEDKNKTEKEAIATDEKSTKSTRKRVTASKTLQQRLANQKVREQIAESKAKEAAALSKAGRGSGAKKQSAGEKEDYSKYAKNLKEITKAMFEREKIEKELNTTPSMLAKGRESREKLLIEYEGIIGKLTAQNELMIEQRRLSKEQVAQIEAEAQATRRLNSLKIQGQKGGASNIFEVISGNIKNTITRMFDYTGVYRVLNKLMASVSKIIQLSKELDSTMFNLRVVTGGSREETVGLIGDYRKLADQLGATTVQIANAANEWLRQGYEAQQANELITASTYLSKLGMIESGQATEYLTSMIKGFKLEVSDAIDVVSKLTAVDMEAASSAGDIAAALQNVSTTAQLAGVSLDETIAYATTIIETTQRDASSVGMALRTIMSRYGNVKAGAYTKMNLESSSDTDLENLNDIEKVLGKIGISIRSTNTEFRSFSDVLEELSDKWINLDNVSKNAIATAMAGVRQREQFLVLMENMDRVEELEQISATSQGTAEEKYSAYMETIEAASNRLQSAWEDLAMKLEQSGLVKLFTDLAVLFTKVLLPAIQALGAALIQYNAIKIPSQIKKIAQATKDLFTFSSDYTQGKTSSRKSVRERLFGKLGIKSTTDMTVSQEQQLTNQESSSRQTLNRELTRSGVLFGQLNKNLDTDNAKRQINGKTIEENTRNVKNNSQELGNNTSQLKTHSKTQIQSRGYTVSSGGVGQKLQLQQKEGFVQSLKSNLPGAALAGIVSGIMGGATADGSKGAKIASGTIQGVLTGVGSVFGPVGSIIGSVAGNIIGPLVAKAIDKDATERAERVEKAAKGLSSIKSAGDQISNLSSIIEKNSFDGDDIKSIREYVQGIYENTSADDTEVFSQKFAEEIETYDSTLPSRFGYNTASELYAHLDDALLKASDGASARNTELMQYLERARIEAEKELYIRSMEEKRYEGMSLAEKSQYDQKLALYDLQLAYNRSNVSSYSERALFKMGKTGVMEAVAEKLGVELTDALRRQIEAQMKTDPAMKNLLAGNTYTLREVMTNAYGLEDKVIDEQQKSFADAMGVSVDRLNDYVDTFGDIVIGNLIQSTEKLRESIESTIEVMDSWYQTGDLTLDTMSSLIKQDSSLITKIGNPDELFDALFSSTEQLTSLLAQSLTKDWMSAASPLKALEEDLYSGSIEGFERGTGLDLEFGGVLKNTKNFDEVLQQLETYRLSKMAAGKLTDDEKNKIEALENEIIRRTDEAQVEIERAAAEYAKESYLSNIQDQLEHRLDKEVDALEEQKKMLQDINKQREYENKLIEAKIKLENAQNEKKKVWREGIGWVYEADTAAIADAEKELESLDIEKQTNALQSLIDELQAQRDWMSSTQEEEKYRKMQHILDQWSGNNASSALLIDKWAQEWKEPKVLPAPGEGTTGSGLVSSSVAANQQQNYGSAHAFARQQLATAATNYQQTKGYQIMKDPNGGGLEALGNLSIEDRDAYNKARNEFLSAISSGDLQEWDKTSYAETEKYAREGGATPGLGKKAIVSIPHYDKGDEAWSITTINPLTGEESADFVGAAEVMVAPSLTTDNWSNDWKNKLYFMSAENKLIKVKESGKPKIKHGEDVRKLTNRLLYNSANHAFYYVGDDGQIYDAQVKNYYTRQVLATNADKWKYINAENNTGYLTEDPYKKGAKTPMKLLQSDLNGSTGWISQVPQWDYAYVQSGNNVNKKMPSTYTKNYATGTLSVPGGLSFVNDDPQYGLEGIITPQGTLTALPSKSGVVPADMTRNVWQLGEVAPNLIKQLVDINGKFNSPLGFGTDESFNVDHLDVHMVAQPGFDMDDFVRQLRAARDLSKHS